MRDPSALKELRLRQNRAVDAVRRGQWQSAEDLLAPSVGTPLAHVSFWTLYATVAEALNHTAAAWSRIRRALLMDPSQAKLTLDLARIGAKLGEETLAQRWVPRLAAIRSEDPASHYRLALLRGLGPSGSPSAQRSARRALVLDPGRSAAVLTHAVITRIGVGGTGRVSDVRMLKICCPDSVKAHEILFGDCLTAGCGTEADEHFRRLPPTAEEQVVARLLGGGGAVLDIGANLGQSAYGFLRAGAHRVVCIEPNPNMTALLRANLGDRVRVIDVALADRVGEADLVYSARIPAGASLDPGFNAAMIEAHGDLTTVRVPVRRLDGLDIAPCDFWKIDVEGLEIEVIKGAAAILASRPPRWILIEIMGPPNRPAEHLNAVIETLAPTHPHRYDVLVGHDGRVRTAELGQGATRTPPTKRGTPTPLYLFAVDPVPG